MRMKTFIETFGWYGTVAIVDAYALVSFGFLAPDNIWYQVLNGTGAAGIVTVSMYKKVYQSAVLNTIWTIIAVVAIVRLLV